MRRVSRKRETTPVGLYDPVAPGDAPSRVPKDLTLLDETELMELFGEMTAWVNFHGTRLAAAQVDEKFAESVLEIRRAQAVLGRTTKSATEAKANAMADPAVQEANEAYLAAYKVRKYEEAAYNTSDRLERLVSRELTRRTGRSDRERRGNRWQS